MTLPYLLATGELKLEKTRDSIFQSVRISFLTWIPCGTSDTSVTGPPGLSVCDHLWEASWAFARLTISQIVVRAWEQLRTADFISLPRRFCMQASPSLELPLLLLPLPSFLLSLLPSPPSSSPPALHPLRSSVRFLAFVSKERDCDCVRVVYVRLRPMPETCGVFKPAGPPISPTSHPVAALKWGPSAECLCVCLSNPHKDPSLFHKFI